MKCNHVQQRLDDLLDGQLSTIEQEAITQHLQDCETCRTLLADSQQLLLQLRDIPVPAPRPGYEQRVLAFLEAKQPTRQHHGWFAAGFATAVVAILAVWLLFVPGTMQTDDPVSVVTIQLAPQQERKVSLVFNSPVRIKQATLHLELPDNIELSGYAGRRTLEWKTDLQAGTNRLTLPLIAKGKSNGPIHASLSHGGKTRAFQIQIETTSSSTQHHGNVLLTT